MTTDEAMRLIPKSETEVRAVLNRLVEFGVVEIRGERKGRTWHLSAATYRRLGKPAAYVRQRGFELLQKEQMVVPYVRGMVGSRGARPPNCISSALFRQHDS